MYKDIREVSLELLKDRHTMIHYFGLGFIQIKLGEKYRIHFYNEKLPAIVGEEEIHNHRYGFESTILFGEFTQEIFEIVSGESHALELEDCKEGYCPTSKSQLCSIEKTMEQTFTTGSSYYISHQVFHRVRAVNAITLLERGEMKKDLAEVVRIVGSNKICPFSIKIPEPNLWELVEEMLTRAKI